MKNISRYEGDQGVLGAGCKYELSLKDKLNQQNIASGLIRPQNWLRLIKRGYLDVRVYRLQYVTFLLSFDLHNLLSLIKND